MSVFVKICGICSRSDLEQISVLNPDAIGFVQWPKSKRFVAPATVGQWQTPAHIKRVGVFVDPSLAEISVAVSAARLDVVQVHRVAADWTVDRSLFPEVEFWNAINPDEMDGDTFSFPFDRYLLDSYDPKTIGGTGVTCDWNRARERVESLDLPVLLAGGLTPENVSEAIEHVKPWGVDVSSGVEIEPGKKHIEKVKQFIGQCR